MTTDLAARMRVIFHRILPFMIGVLMLAPTRGSAQVLQDSTLLSSYISADIPSLTRLITSVDKDSLITYYRSLPVHDIAVRAVYATRLMALSDTKDGVRQLLQAMPTDDLQLDYLYLLTERPTGNKQLDSLLSDVVDAMPRYATTTIVNHPHFVQRYFRFAYVAASNGDLGEEFSYYLSRLVEKHCVWFFHKLELANPEVVETIMEGFHVDTPNMSCIEAHRAEIPARFIDYLETLARSEKASNGGKP